MNYSSSFVAFIHAVSPDFPAECPEEDVITSVYPTRVTSNTTFMVTLNAATYNKNNVWGNGIVRAALSADSCSNAETR
jgi:hypothetical protein